MELSGENYEGDRKGTLDDVSKLPNPLRIRIR